MKGDLIEKHFRIIDLGQIFDLQIIHPAKVWLVTDSLRWNCHPLLAAIMQWEWGNGEGEEGEEGEREEREERGLVEISNNRSLPSK